MTSLESAVREASKLIVPSAPERAKLERISTRLLAIASRSGLKYPEFRGVLLGGSFAKGTWIPRHVDLDVFVRIAPDTSEDRFEEVGLAIGTEATRGFPKGKKYAQHPYTEAKVNGIKVNVVPCFDVVKGDWKSAADRSPFHVELVRNISREQKDEVKLLKVFMKGVGVYGAEIEVQGFSGYAAEVLVMSHGSLTAVLRYFAEIKFPDDAPLFSVRDPVDPERDLGVAVSAEKLARMVLASREFLRSPSKAFFTGLKGRENSAIADRVVAVVFSHKELSEDTLWGELRKSSRHIVKHVEGHGFRIARSLSASDNSKSSAFLFIPETTNLPELEQRIGPTVDRKRDLEAFLKSNRKSSRLVWVDDDARVRVLRPREFTEVSDLLIHLVKGKAESTGASPEIAKGLRKSGRVLHGARLRRAGKSLPWLGDGIGEIVRDALGTRAD